jgi:hypothetical protein
MSRYDALTTKLRSLSEPEVVLTFDELDDIVGSLPTSAKKYGAWWANRTSSQAHARAWLEAGRYAKPDFRARHAVFTTTSLAVEASSDVSVQNSPSGDGNPRAPQEVSNNLNHLDRIGFTAVGWWELTETGISFELNEVATARNILYAFVIDGHVSYIGKTTQSLRARMAGYKTPGPTQSTNIRNHARIRQLLIAGALVEIFALPDSGLLYYGGFHVNLAAGLEDSLVRDLRPPWNGGRTEGEYQRAEESGPARRLGVAPPRTG